MEFKNITEENIEIATKIFMNSFNAEPWFEKWTMETGKERLSQIMRCEGALGLIAYKENKPCAVIVGHEEAYYDGVRFLIKEFCVDSNSKGGGIGTKTLQYYMSKLKERGIVQTSFYTMRNKQILNFYKKNGFKEIEDLLMMESV